MEEPGQQAQGYHTGLKDFTTLSRVGLFTSGSETIAGNVDLTNAFEASQDTGRTS